MIVVIFRARLNQLNEEYFQTAARLCELALGKYGCVEFISLSEGDEEVSISYWNSEKDIRAWKADAEHRVAQEKGRTTWYKHYRVETANIERSYSEK